MIDLTTFKNTKFKTIKVYTAAEITRALILKCKEPFEKVYKNVTNFDKMVDAIFYNPDFCAIFWDTVSDQPVAFVFILPATIDTCKKIISGEIKKTELCTDSFDYDKNKYMLDLVVYGIAFAKQFLEEETFELYLEYFIDAAIRKSKGGKYINSIIFEKDTSLESFLANLFNATKQKDNVYSCLFNIDCLSEYTNYNQLQKAYDSSKNIQYSLND